MDRRVFIAVCVVLVVLIALLIIIFWPEKQEGPITCQSDENCGGDIIAEKFCRDGNVYGQGQRNVCIDAGKSTSRCETTYGDILIEECENGCEGTSCV